MEGDQPDKPDEVQVMEEELYEVLPSLGVGELETVFEKMQVTCPEAAKGKKNVLLRLLYKQLVVLVSSEDNGFATIKIVHDFVTGVKPVKNENEDDEDTEELKKFEAMLDKKIKNLHDLAATVATPNKNKVEVSKFHTLKINGTIGTKSGCMSYTDLNFQIRNAQEQGYSDEHIRGAVIKAMATNNNLRTYFETVPDCSLDEMLEILRPYFEQKNSASLFADLCNAAQASEQNCMDFVVGLLGLKLRIADLSAEEGVPMDNKRLVGQFQKSLFTGIRNTNIRTEIREFCRGDPTATDQMLIKTVAEAMAIEKARAKKMAGGSDVCYLGLDNGVESTSKPVNTTQVQNKKKENLLPAQIQELMASQELLVATVSELQTSMATANSILAAHVQNGVQNGIPQNNPLMGMTQNGQNSFSFGGNRPGLNPHSPAFNTNNNKKKKVFKCEPCIQQNVPRCTHCLCCGSVAHKIKDCPQKNQGSLGGGNGQGQGNAPGL